MGISILTPAIVGLMLVAGVCYKMSEEMLREQIATDMSALLECQSIGLDAVFSGLEQGLQTMTDNQRIKDQVQAYAEGRPEAFEGALFSRADRALESFVTSNETVYYAGIIAVDGKVLGHRIENQQGPSKFIGTDFTDREYFQKSIKPNSNHRHIPLPTLVDNTVRVGHYFFSRTLTLCMYQNLGIAREIL